MNGWGGGVAQAAETAIAGLPNLTAREPGEQLLTAGYFWVMAAGAEQEDGANTISVGNDFLQIRESATISMCVRGSDGTMIDLIPVFRAVRKALSEAEYDDPLIELPEDVVYLVEASEGKPAAVTFGISGRRAVAF